MVFSIFGEDYEHNRRRLVEAANKAPKGISASHLVPGAVVTVGPNKATGDRSYMDEIFEVIAVAGVTVGLRSLHGGPSYRGEKPVLVQVHEREFYEAEHLLAEVSQEEGPAG